MIVREPGCVSLEVHVEGEARILTGSFPIGQRFDPENGGCA
jgi:hypothetical protein